MHQATLRVVVTLNHTNDIEFSVHCSRKSLQAVVRSAGVLPCTKTLSMSHRTYTSMGQLIEVECF